MVKPDEIPIKIARAKASHTWKFEDYKWCWYWKLLIESADSERPGYLRYDLDRLWRLAGARSKEFFLKRGGTTILNREFKRTEDGTWLYHPHMLQIVESKQVRQNDSQNQDSVISYIDSKKRKPKIFFIESEELRSLFEEGYQCYPRHVGKRAAEKAYAQAVGRIVKLTGVSYADAAKSVNLAANVFAHMPAGKRGSYTPHMSTWLNQDRFLDDQKEWQVGSEREESLEEYVARLESGSRHDD